jgi:putative PIN family toxin of toxin-antitoxin system
MKVFFDTNVLIAAFVARGTCSDLFDYCLSEHTICISQGVLDEFSDRLINKFGFTRINVEQAVSFVKGNVLVLSCDPLSSRICRDPDDDNVLAAAVSGKVQCVVTGDEDLLVLKRIQKIPIIKPSEFWKFEKGRRKNN